MENKISTGSFDLNDWLEGGYEKNVITMIAGPPGSGKTNLTILAACSQAKANNKIIFIDTEGGFSIERVKQIVGDNYEKYIENILLLEPTNFQEQEKAFEKLLKTLKKEYVGLIIIDSLAMLYRLELGDAIQSKNDEKIKNVNYEMAKQMRTLAEITRKKKIPILITNQVYKNFQSNDDKKDKKSEEINIVGGDLFKYWSKCIIELKRDNEQREAILLKHRNIKFKKLKFEIQNKGIFKKKWL